ncbi:lytic transglycosylase domain-containing protein [Rhizohabitans arisaemae]|uniref:lytic transglycosylase domain-containing protein n=1 Tax=Rhizohabitans arisaemae TaxID=2720610 RepID=UPI0024B05630|nr:lytic transglycosylase domain-containing protein [Rhizohabitans arisaemae]
MTGLRWTVAFTAVAAATVTVIGVSHLRAGAPRPVAAYVPSPPPPAPLPVAVPSAVPAPSRAAGAPSVTPVPPRLIAVTPVPVPQETLHAIATLKGVSKVTAVDGGSVRLHTYRINLLAVDPAEFRSWAPPAVAARPELWSALAQGEFILADETRARLGMRVGGEYAVHERRLRVGGSAPLGIPGVDGLVSLDTGRGLGLMRSVAVLVNAPVDRVGALGTDLRRLLGGRAQVVPLVPVRPAATPSAPGPQAPVPAPVRGRPASFLELYKQSALICPGLSWSVLAAIGQIESNHGRNNGPSSAGALGPMQFMPGTWRAYGLDGDGDGKADVWSAYDAVPSAARYLCANKAGQGGKRLEQAVWRYNHSWAYVRKVLNLAEAYARAYP